MKDINKVILIGHIGINPIQKQSKTGKTRVYFSLATNRRIRRFFESDSKTHSEFQEETQWHRIIVWGKQGEMCAKYLEKGQKVYIEGSLRSRTYLDPAGIQKIIFEIHTENISFLSHYRRPLLQTLSENAEGTHF